PPSALSSLSLHDALPISDQLGVGFEQKLTDLFTPPAEDNDKDSRPAAHASAFGRGKGTVFLVDLKSHAVIWSLYEKPGRATPDRSEEHTSELQSRGHLVC